MSGDVKQVWIVGVGPMGVEHARALQALQEPFVAVGRSVESTSRFAERTGVVAEAGGLERSLLQGAPSHAIVAVGVPELFQVTSALISAGTQHILVEKPAATTAAEVHALRDAAAAVGAHVHIAYNRRTYASVRRAREIIDEDGGVSSLHFEFTEFADRVGPSKSPEAVKAAWFFANSSHVVDLAFFLAGAPRAWSAWSAGGLSWHPSASRFVGAGVTERDALFSYGANWESGGRWGVEVMTPRRRLLLRPLEELSQQLRSEVAITPVLLDVEAEGGCKPGVREMVRAWLAGTSTLPTIAEHAVFFTQVLEPMLRGQR
jgi:predicted dehydrogenase